MSEQVTLVDQNDHFLAYLDKIEAHQKGLMHRVISVFIFNHQHEILIQKRALTKCHTPAVWSKTASGYSRKYQDAKKSAERRLMQEMGFSAIVINNSL